MELTGNKERRAPQVRRDRLGQPARPDQKDRGEPLVLSAHLERRGRPDLKVLPGQRGRSDLKALLERRGQTELRV